MAVRSWFDKLTTNGLPVIHQYNNAGLLNQSQCEMYILRTAIRSQGSRLDRRGGFQTRPYQWTARAPANPPAMKRNLA